MAARIRPEDVRDALLRQLLVQRLVLGVEAPVAAPHVERDERLSGPQFLADGRQHEVDIRLRVARGRAEIERLRAGRVGGVEVAAPRLDDGELVQVMERELHCAVPAGGDADQRATRTGTDRPEACIDDARQLGRDRRRPLVAGAAVDVFGIALARARPLRDDDDRGTAHRVERALDESERRVGGSGGRQPVQHVEHGIALRAHVVTLREVHLEVESRADRRGRECAVHSPLGRGCRGRAEKGHRCCACQGQESGFQSGHAIDAQRALNVTKLHTDACGPHASNLRFRLPMRLERLH